MQSYTISGNIVDILNREIFYGEVIVEGSKITSIKNSQQ